MTKIVIDTEHGCDYYEQQIAEMETKELINLYDIMTRKQSILQIVGDELVYRGRTGHKIASEKQIHEIEQIL